MRTQGEDRIYMPESEASEEPNPANTVLSDSQPPELWENKCLLFKPPMLECFAPATLANEYTITWLMDIDAVSRVFSEEEN